MISLIEVIRPQERNLFMSNGKKLAILENRISAVDGCGNPNDAEVMLEASPSQMSTDFILITFTSMPIFMAGMFGPAVLAPELYHTDLYYVPSAISFAIGILPIIGFNSDLRPVRMIRHQFKNTTGERITLKSARVIRAVQKSLTEHNPVSIIPAKTLLSDSPMLRMAEAKGLELGVVVRPDSIGLRIVKPENPDTSWDNALESLSDIYQL